MLQIKLHSVSRLTILSAIKPATFHPASDLIMKVSLFGYVIYSPADIQLPAVCISRRIRQPNKPTLPIMMLERWNLSRLMEEDGEHNGVGFVEMSIIFAM